MKHIICTTMSKEALSDNIFHNGNGVSMDIDSVIDDMRAYIAKNPEAAYEIVVGSDSQTVEKGHAGFVTAIVLRRMGNGGIHFWIRREEKFFTLRDRIWREAMLSITLAQELKSRIKDRLGEEMFWEHKIEFRCIHIDVGENGPTKDFIDGISGMVKGFGFVPVIKPYAYGAFVVADMHT